MKIEFELNEDFYIDAKNIVLEEGLDIDTVVNIFFKKIVKEGSIGFLFGRKDNEVNTPNSVSQSVNVRGPLFDNRMTKSIAKRLFMDKGFKIGDNCVFASENSSTHIFWANIHYSVLSQNWSLILNDKSKKILHLLSIPAGEFNADDLVMRADKPEIIDLQIAYNDPTFTDNRSRLSFSKYLVESINY